MGLQRVRHNLVTGHGFPVGKESSCTAGDSSLIPGSGRSTGEEMSNPLQYYWASLAPGYLPKPGIEPRSPTLQAVSSPAELSGKPMHVCVCVCVCVCVYNLTNTGTLQLDLQIIFPSFL